VGDLHHRLEVAALVRTPDLDHHGRPRLCHPPRLAQRRDHVVGKEERIEPRDEVERVVLVGQGLHLADAQVGLGQAGAGELNQRLGRV
jgi:hypothetical protein